MAHTLGIGVGGASYSLSSTNAMLLNYGLTPASFEAVAADPEAITTVDSIDLMIYGSTTAIMMDVYEQIERYMMLARRRQTTNTGDKIYVFLQMDGEDSYRSEILSGFVRPGGDAFQAFASAQMPVTLVIERRGYWEESSPSTAKSATGITNIGNANYVDITGSAVKGSLPTPAIVNIENTSGASINYKRIWIWNNAFNDPANFDGYLVGSSLSGGDNIVSFTADIDAEEYWTLTDAFLTDTAGCDFRVLAACSDAPTVPGHWHMKVKFLTTLVRFTGGELYDMNVGINDLGVVPLPPGGYEAGNADHNLYMCVRNTTTDTATIQFVSLAPADNTRYIFQSGTSVLHGSSIVDDGVAGTVYIKAGSDQYPLHVPRGNPVMLWPGQTQRLHVLVDESGTWDSTWTHDVTVTYRARKVTL